MWQDFSWCFSKWAFCLKPRPHVVHLKGRSFVWVLKCTWRFDLRFLGNFLPQTGQTRISSATLPSWGHRGKGGSIIPPAPVEGGPDIPWGLSIPVPPAPLLESPRDFDDRSFWNKQQMDQAKPKVSVGKSWSSVTSRLAASLASLPWASYVNPHTKEPVTPPNTDTFYYLYIAVQLYSKLNLNLQRNCDILWQIS